jgi:hypothetical protein
VSLPTAWRYAAAAALGIVGVASTSLVDTTRAACAGADLPYGSCAPTFLVQYQDLAPNTLWRVNPGTGSIAFDSNWSGSIPLDLSRADYDPDGTLYVVMKTDSAQRSPRWAAVDMRSSRVTNVATIPPDINVIDFAFTPSVNASPRGYLLGGDPGPNGALQLYSIDSAWPLVLTPRTTNFPVHNNSMGLGVSPDGDVIYHTMRDRIDVLLPSARNWQPYMFTGIFGIHSTAQVAGPAAGDPQHLVIVDSRAIYNIDVQDQTVDFTPTPTHFQRGVLFRECPVGGVRLVPQSGLTTTEAGGTAQFTAVLTTRPQGDVTVSFKSTDPAEGKVRGRPIVFTPSDWDVSRTVTVQGVPDGVADGTASYWITADPMESSDPAYDGRQVGRIPAINIDVDIVRPDAPAPVGLRRVR